MEPTTNMQGQDKSHRVTTDLLTHFIYAKCNADHDMHPHIRKTLPRLYRSVNKEGIITRCNETYVKKLGHDSIQEVVGTHIDTHMPPDIKAMERAMFEEWWKNPVQTTCMIRIMTKQGNMMELIARITGRADKSGNITEMSAIMMHMTELESLQKLVRIKKYESLYENSPDLYRTVNYNGTIIDCNMTYIKKMGFTSKREVLGRNLVEHTADKSVDALRRNMSDWRRTGKSKTTEIWMKRKDGSIFPSILTPTNIYDDENNMIGRNVVIKDATELFDTKHLLSEQEKTDRMKEEFLSVVTHELKSPLTPIIGFAQALGRPKLLGDLNDKQRDAVTTILSNAQRLRKLIVDMLDAHKLELEKMRFDLQEMSVNVLLERINKSFRIAAQEKDITVHCSVKGQFDAKGEGLEIKIISDTSRLEQVITNLVYNAVDFIPKGTGKITVTAEKIDGTIKFSIQDNGCGIPPEKQKQLFTKFYQANTSHTRKHGGTGLGLAICRGIVNGLGGEIYVESIVGKGSNFYFILPENSKHNENSTN